MGRTVSILTSEEIRERLLHPVMMREADGVGQDTPGTAAELQRCPVCGSWWGAGDYQLAAARQVWQWVEPHSNHLLWEAYYGWRVSSADRLCRSCGEGWGATQLELRIGENGEIAWLEGGLLESAGPESAEDAPGGSDPFRSYVAGSKGIEENVAAIEAREAKRAANVWGYAADIDDIRDDLERVGSAFKDVVYGYAPLLPPGWRVIADFDKWVMGKACAGFVHGDMSPDKSLLIGGDCSTVADLAMRLDKLFLYVCECA